MVTRACDVAVVGSGVAGLSAALAAHEQGASVIVVERAPKGEHGGNTRYTEAFLRMKSVDEPSDDFEERLAESAGYHIDPAMLEEMWRDEDNWHPLARTLNVATPTLITRFAAEAGRTVTWLQSFGLRFEQLATPFITVSTTRLAPVGGGLAIVDCLTQQLEERAVDFEFTTTASSLIQSHDGSVVGLHAQRADGSRIEVTAAGTVLGSGGFEGNPEMMARYVDRSEYVRPVARGGYYNRGEGIDMALRIGAAAGGNFRLFHAEPIDPRSSLPEPALFVFPYGVLINSAGKRFVDEAPAAVDATYEAITREILLQPGGSAFIVLDHKIEDVPNYTVGVRTNRRPITADSIEQLASHLKIEEAPLCQTIAEYNAACPATTQPFMPLSPDGLATEHLVPPKSNWARPIDTPPYRAYPIACANVFSFGGLLVSSRAEVIRTDGQLIDGLYAAGETMGLYHGPYVGSTSVLRGAVFGRLAGQHAAIRALTATTPSS